MARKANKKGPRKITRACPECGSRAIIPVLHGIITGSQKRIIAAGKAIAADREEWEGMSEWYCKSCGCDWSRHSRRFKRPGGVNATRAD